MCYPASGVRLGCWWSTRCTASPPRSRRDGGPSVCARRGQRQRGRYAMTASTFLAPDAQAIVLACAHLATGDADGTRAGAKPFAPAEWADLATKIYRSPLKTPAALLDRSVSQIQEALELP